MINFLNGFASFFFLFKSYAPIVHRFPQPPLITQETSSQSARTSVASGGRLSILSEKLSRLSISSNQSGRPSVASDSVLLHKKSEGGRLSHSYEDSDTQTITTHYSGRRGSKAPRLSIAENGSQSGVSSSGTNGKNIRFQLFPRSSDAVEQSISSVEQSSGIFDEQPSVSSRRSSTKNDSNPNPTRRQSLLRSPSSRYAIPKFPIVGKPSGHAIRTSLPPSEQAFLSPPMSPQSSLHMKKKNKTLRAAMGAITPDLYISNTSCTTIEDEKGNSVTTVNNNGIISERNNDELAMAEEETHRIHIRIVYDEHRNDLIINVIEGMINASHLPFHSFPFDFQLNFYRLNEKN